MPKEYPRTIVCKGGLGSPVKDKLSAISFSLLGLDWIDIKMSLFTGCQITLELDSSLSFKKKTELKRKVIDNGGIISFIVTKKVFNRGLL